jgi:cyclase
LTVFYTGRLAPPSVPADQRTWGEAGALDLGIATFAIHSGREALVYDTFTSTDLAKWVRSYLEQMGIARFTLVNSHWHLDHVGGNAVYQDSTIIGNRRTFDSLTEKKEAIEAGKLWGPPAIKPLVLPNLMFDKRLDVQVGAIRVELHNINIHTADSVVALLPSDKILLAGDTLEDSVTFVSEPDTVVEQLPNFKLMKQWDFTRILPNHGNPKVIAAGGYDKTLIDATSNYVRLLLAKAHDKGFVESAFEDYITDSVAKGWVSAWKPYQHVHEVNVKRISKVYQDKPLPRLED